MNPAPIHLSREDYTKLRLLVAAALKTKASATLAKLRDELDRAIVVDANALPRDVVTMNATVEFEDLGTGEIERYTITFPEMASIEKQRISILSPIGTALIGYRAGDLVQWSTPGGQRELKLLQVTPPGAELSVPELRPALG